MKIKVKKLPYNKVLEIKPPKHKTPVRPVMLLRIVLKVASQFELIRVRFRKSKVDMDKTNGEPCLVLMNHSCFLDLMIASDMLFPKPFCIVTTTDGMVGITWLKRWIGCIPTKKFVSDPALIGNMLTALKKKKCNVLMYPEASYSFDGTATTLPRRLGLLLKKLDVPVVTITTAGAFTRQPLYNCLKKRKVKVSAEMKCILSRSEIKEKSVDELDAILDKAFAFDGFKWQQENNVRIDSDDRAEGLERILYKCAHCGTEAHMHGSGTTITCNACGKTYELDEYGYLKATDGDSKFTHVPDWYRWERMEVKKELEQGNYSLVTDVKVHILADMKTVYDVGEGILTHDESGFNLKACGGELNFTQSPLASYGLYADYYWYSIGDVICIGDKDRLYYCFPKGNVPVAKARLAAEELYKIKREQKRKK